jgi:hypothetical protein
MALGADGTVRRWLAGGLTAVAAVLAVCTTASAAHAGRFPTRAGGARHHPPTLLTDTPGDSHDLHVRPTFSGFYHQEWHSKYGFFDYLMGPGLTRREYDKGQQTPIVWTHWGARAAGRATYWVYDCAATCQYSPRDGYLRREVTLAAWRVREGHYTRFSITWRRSTVVYAFERTRIPTNGVPGGLPAFTWCWAKYPKPCTSP